MELPPPRCGLGKAPKQSRAHSGARGVGDPSVNRSTRYLIEMRIDFDIISASRASLPRDQRSLQALPPFASRATGQQSARQYSNAKAKSKSRHVFVRCPPSSLLQLQQTLLKRVLSCTLLLLLPRRLSHHDRSEGHPTADNLKEVHTCDATVMGKRAYNSVLVGQRGEAETQTQAEAERLQMPLTASLMTD